ncbi:MAG: DUF4250 domain-containing protein [Clostridia bacterium]|nr:DUF4250 domain-containing protein [Clostridia bacterium]
MNIPKDPFILLSFVNTKLRDFHDTLDDLCKSLDIDQKWLTDTLAGVGFEYNEQTNQFK